MKIAMIGTRGIPASYSGFETCVEELGVRLVERGHQVTVYCRTPHISYAGKYYRGMRLIKLPTITNKYLDTLFHTFLSCFQAITQRYDIAMMFIVGNSPLALLLRLARQKVALNVDGLDWKRDKWPLPAKKYLQFSEFLATKFPHEVITDSRQVQNYYRTKFSTETTFIAYGANLLNLPPGHNLAKYNLLPRQYILFTGRLVPENCAHHLIAAFNNLATDFKCVIIGDAPYAEEYIKTLKSGADSRVIFTGYLFGEGYQELSCNAYAFVETSAVGGTHPALLEAMAFGNCVVVNNTLENLETIGEAGLSYEGQDPVSSLSKVIRHLLDNPAEVEKYRELAIERVKNHYNWDDVTDQYEALFFRLINNK